MVRQTTKVIVLEVFGVISLLLMAAAAVLAFMLASGPVELSLFHDDVERAMTSSRKGRPVSIESVTLEWSPAQRRLFVVASGVSLKDRDGKEAGHTQRAELVLDAGSIFLGEMEVLQVHLEDGWVNLQNTGPNQFEVAGDPLPEIKTAALPQTPREWLDRTNSVLRDVLSGVEVLQDTFTLEGVSFDKIEVRYISMAGEDVGKITNASGGLERSEADVAILLTGEGGGVGLPGQFELALSTSENVNAMRADLTIKDWPVADLAGRFGVTDLNDDGLITDITFGSGVTRAEGVERIDIKIERKDGSLTLPFGDEQLNELYLDLSYLVEDASISINQLALETDRLGGVFTGRLENVLSENALRRVELASDDVRLDLSEYFPAAWRLKKVELNADLSDDFTIIAFDRLRAEVDGVKLQASGELDWSVEHADGELPLSLDIAAEAIGELQTSTILKFWPERLGAGARRFVVDRITQGTGTGATATARLRPDSMAEGGLRDTDLLVGFSFKDAEVKFLKDLPPARNVSGTGRLTGNSFLASAVSAEYDDWAIDSVAVEFPTLRPRGSEFTVEAVGSGPAVSILRQLSASRLKLQEQTGFDPERVSGDAQVELFMSRPALNTAPFSATALEVKGTIRDAGLKAAAGGFDLTDGSAQLDMTQERLIITGYGEIGQAPVQFTWRDALQTDNTPADLSASAIVTPDVLNRFGLVGRAYLSGEIPVEMQGQVNAKGLGKASFAFDLRDARIDVDEIGWVKPAGEAARATLTYSGDGDRQISAVRLTSDTAQLDGDVLLGADGRLQSLTLRKLFIERIADVAGTVRRLPNGGAKLSLNGAYLDVSSILGDIGAVGGAGDGVKLALEFDATVDRLRLRRGLELNEATLEFKSDADGLRAASATGVTQSGAELKAGFTAQTNGAPKVFLNTEDAGFLAQAFLDLDYISGGTLDLTGTLAHGSEPMRLMAKVENARLSNAPFFTQILSLASLRGLTDTLAGEGVMFTKIEVPITVGGGRYVIDGARASGPALGLTVNGWIGTEGDGIELDGVLVPSFGVNSVLGGVPVIGDLFVGRRGEGIFSITYGISGTLEKAQVSINPLSAVTPGILRRIFENPSDTSIPDAIPVDPNLKPPTEKLPELPDDEFIPSQPGGGG